MSMNTYREKMCKAITKNGTLCTRDLLGVCPDFCWQHTGRQKVTETELFDLNTPDDVTSDEIQLAPIPNRVDGKESLDDDDKFIANTLINIPIHTAVSAETLHKHALSPDKYEYITLEKVNPKFALARVGVIQDGSCLFHSIVFLEFFNDLSNDVKTRQLFVETMKNEFFNKFSSERWLLYASDEWKTRILEILRGHIVTELDINYSELDMLMDSLLATRITFSQFREELPKAIHANIPTIDEKNVSILIGQAVEEAFTRYKTSLQRCSSWAGSDEIDMFSDQFDINIFSFDSNGILSFKDCSQFSISRPSILLYNQGGTHWEPIVLTDAKGEKQTLELPPNSELIHELLEKYGC